MPTAPTPTTTDDVRALADELHAFRLAEDPIAASAMGLRGFDAGVPDVSAAADARRRAVYADLLDRTRRVVPAATDAADAITAACVLATVEAALAEIDAGAVEFTVSAAMGEGPAVALGLASRTKLSDEASARDWLSRVGGLTGYLDTVADRLRTGAAAGRTPVHTLVVTAVAQLDRLLAAGAPGPFLDPFAAVAPAGTGGGGGTDDIDGPPPAWVAELSAAVAAEVDARLWPALGRYRDLLRDELLPVARPDDACGLLNLDGGPAAYRALVRLHTTLPLSPEEIHQQGLADVEENHRRMLVIGGPLYGVDTVAGVLDALRRAGATPDPAAAMVKARAAVRLAEAAAPAWFAPPAAPPCAVEPMAELLALAGMPPHYTPPSEDGTRVGTYWFNADRPGLGTGPEVESVTYHESVPGHHLQLVRMLSLTHIPALQRQTVVTAHCEGWGLYAEVLAQEMGLYPDDEAVLGMLATDTFRAGRLVVDTGIHALGWSREQAITFFADAVPLPRDALTAEIDRYIGVPGQALAYKTGQREILRLRSAAERELGDRFDIRGFHAAVLDSGSVPLPALARAVAAWVESVPA